MMTVYRVAAVDAAGKRKPLGASANRTVMDLGSLPDGSTLYLAGSFTQIAPQRGSIAGAVDQNKVTSRSPGRRLPVRSITVATDNSAVIGGSLHLGGEEVHSDAHRITVLEEETALYGTAYLQRHPQPRVRTPAS